MLSGNQCMLFDFHFILKVDDGDEKPATFLLKNVTFRQKMHFAR
jgi:hypothetical protein